MTRRSKADRKKVVRAPSPTPAQMVDMRSWGCGEPQSPPPDVRALGCMNGGRFAQCDCLVCVQSARKDGA